MKLQTMSNHYRLLWKYLKPLFNTITPFQRINSMTLSSNPNYDVSYYPLRSRHNSRDSWSSCGLHMSVDGLHLLNGFFGYICSSFRKDGMQSFKALRRVIRKIEYNKIVRLWRHHPWPQCGYCKEIPVKETLRVVHTDDYWRKLWSESNEILSEAASEAREVGSFEGKQ